MKRNLSFFLALCLLLTLGPLSYANRPQQNAVYELYSADGCYEDGAGNRETYSYHVPQIQMDTPAAEEINAEIAEGFGQRVDEQFQNMEDGCSLWCWRTEWEAYWNGSQLFLLITADENGDITEYGVYGYDVENGSRITNAMILRQKGISEGEYMEKLREAVSLLFEDLYRPIPEGVETSLTHDSLLEDTLSWLSADQPIFLNRYGDMETWVAIAAPAGAGKYNHLITIPFDQESDGGIYSIHLVGDTYLVESCPETAKAGETVSVLTRDVTDGDKKITVSGTDGINIDWFEYQFVMPNHDVKVRVEFIGNGLA